MILLRPICWLLGHRRGKPVRRLNVREFGAVGDGVTDDSAAFQAAIDTRVFRCPRCGRETRYRIKPQSAPVNEQPEDDAFTYGRNPKQDEQEDRRLDDPRTGQGKALNRDGR